MDFREDTPIFRQIVDLCHERIMTGVWREGERVPSVRELGVELTVNAHTALKAYDVLQNEGILVQKRGLGFFLAPDAVEKVRAARKQEFFEQTLPSLFDRMAHLGITIDDIITQYSNRIK